MGGEAKSASGETEAVEPAGLRQRVGLWLGPALFLTVLLALPVAIFAPVAGQLLGEAAASSDVTRLAVSARSTLAIVALVVVWWISEAIPIPVTSLLPGLLLPLLQVSGSRDGQLFDYGSVRALSGYSHPVVFLFLGSFFLAAAFSRWDLDRRISLFILTRGRLAERPATILLGFMIATAICSMWLSNTATTAMMLPLILGVMSRAGCKTDGSSRFGTSLLLGTAFAASIGGMATPVGSPPNALVLSGMQKAGLPPIDFLQWMAFGVPIVLVMLPATWLLLSALFPAEIRSIPGGVDAMRQEHRRLGPLSSGEKGTLAVFAVIVTLWVVRSLAGGWIAAVAPWLDDYLIGLLAAVLLFVVPSGSGGGLLSWKDSSRVEWGTLLLFGGGITLSDALFHTGVARFLAETVLQALGSTPSTVAIVLVLVLLVDLMTEVASNTAIAATMVPIAMTLARQAGSDPSVAATACGLAASLAFMLPVATPPNAIVYGSGRVRMADMVRAGLLLDFLGWVSVVAMLYLVGDLALGLFNF